MRERLKDLVKEWRGDAEKWFEQAAEFAADSRNREAAVLRKASAIRNTDADAIQAILDAEHVRRLLRRYPLVNLSHARFAAAAQLSRKPMAGVTGIQSASPAEWKAGHTTVELKL